MSGGYFEYQQHRISDIASEIEHLIETNEDTSKNEYGEIKGRFYSSRTIKQFKEALVHLNKAAIFAHRIDWLVSGDDGENTFHERLLNELNELNDLTPEEK